LSVITIFPVGHDGLWSVTAFRSSDPRERSSTDPLIVFERGLDPVRREEITWYRDHVESVRRRGEEQLGEACFAVYGKTPYPDCTFTLRLSFGQVKGYPMDGTIAPPGSKPRRWRRRCESCTMRRLWSGKSGSADRAGFQLSGDTPAAN
jgi:hypothetical protein